MSGAVSISEAIVRLRDFDNRVLTQALKQAFYRAMDAGRQKAIRQLQLSKIGVMVERRGNVQLQLGLSSKKRYGAGALATMKESVIPLIVRRSEVRQNYFGNIGLSGGLEAEGFAALIETGGRTRAHQIKRIREGGYSRKRATRAKQVEAGEPMTFQIGSRWVSKRVITHPGSRIPRNPFLSDGARMVERSMPEQVGRSVGEAIKKAGL